MLRFFRNIRRRLLDSGSLRKYLVYALGEIILVVIGILIALQINNWNQEKKEKIRENKTLIELKANLSLNVKNLELFIQAQNELINKMTVLIKHLESNTIYHDSLSAYAEGMAWLEQITLSTSTYETLKNQGVDMISSDSLRLSIVDLHENSYKNFTKLIEDISLAFYTESASPLWRKYGEIKNMWNDKELYYFLKGKVGWKTDLINMAIENKTRTLLLIERIDQHIR